MPRELCKYFQSGSCRYGARCKYLHSTPQQPQQQKSGGFGFGAQPGFQQQQQQQQNPNPFGFGVKSNSQAQPFSNKWVRDAAAPPSSRPADNQSQSANHTCTDPEACKRQIIDDFQNERPMWKLTCYGHWKYLPCDIVGDISYEELQAAAYDDAGRGLSVQAIVERERSLVNSKSAEFENLRRNPYVPRSNSGAGQFSPSPMTNPSSFASSNATPPVVSTFSQAASLSGNLGARPSPPPVAAFGNFSTYAASGSSSSFSNTSPTPSFFGTNSLQWGSSGANSSQFPTQIHMNSQPPNSQVPSASAFGSVSNIFSSAASSQQILSPASNLPTLNFGQITPAVKHINGVQNGTQSEVAKIWLKEKWDPGEIPEEAPPEGTF